MGTEIAFGPGAAARARPNRAQYGRKWPSILRFTGQSRGTNASVLESSGSAGVEEQSADFGSSADGPGIPTSHAAGAFNFVANRYRRPHGRGFQSEQPHHGRWTQQSHHL